MEDRINGDYILRIARYHVMKREKSGIDVDDAIQDVAERLLRKAEKFDSRKSLSFESYIHHHARWAVLDSMRKQGTHYTQKVVWDEKKKTYKRVPGYRFYEYDTTEQIQDLEYTVAELTKAEAINKMATVDKRTTDEWSAIKSCLHNLSIKERTVLFYHFFLELTLAEIGAIHGFTESRACQIKERALLKCYNTLVTERIEPYPNAA